MTIAPPLSPRPLPRSVVVVGPGIVGMPMAALLAHALMRRGIEDARVTVVQRNSPTSGWKVDAINRGESPIGGVEPSLNDIVAEAVRGGVLCASHEYAAAANADAILICVQTDKKGLAPDYGPLFDALHAVAKALTHRTVRSAEPPLIAIESTLAPSSMETVVRPLFAQYGLEEGRDIALGNSPNRVMPGRLVERIAAADKLVGALHPVTAERIAQLYRLIVTNGSLLTTNSLTAEIVKTLENAYRDVRIAFSAEIASYCDRRGIDFFALRDEVNEALSRSDEASGNATAVPSGALLVPTVGVGGHCLPKDGILLWWRALELGHSPNRSVILESRSINDRAPRHTARLALETIPMVRGDRVAVLGGAYRFDSEDTRNSPSLVLAAELRERGMDVIVHDPYVRPHDANLVKYGVADIFTNDLDQALAGARVIVLATGHAVYRALLPRLAAKDASHALVVDACNMFRNLDFAAAAAAYAGIGRGHRTPNTALVRVVAMMFNALERATANEVNDLVELYNTHYARDRFNHASFAEVRRLAATCATGCDIAATGEIRSISTADGFVSVLVRTALGEDRGDAPAVSDRLSGDGRQTLPPRRPVRPSGARR